MHIVWGKETPKSFLLLLICMTMTDIWLLIIISQKKQYHYKFKDFLREHMQLFSFSLPMCLALFIYSFN